MKEFQKENLIKRLLQLDRDAALLFDSEEGRFECYIVGGGALILGGYIPRMTHDIDVIKTKPNELISLMDKYDINCNVNAHLDCFAEGFENRAEKLNIPTEIIDYYVLSLEDLVISKIASGREKDIEDINNKTIVESIDWTKLEELARSAVEGMISDRIISEFWHIYNTFVEENKH